MSHRDESAEIERLIDKTLVALGSAAPAEDLHGRILSHLHARSPNKLSDSSAWIKWVGPVGIAAVAGVLFIALPGTRSSLPQAGSPTSLPNLAKRDMDPTASYAAAPLPDTPPSALRPLAPASLIAGPAPRRFASARVSGDVDGVPVDAQAALALAETQAPSRVAPSLPISVQERLLGRASRSGELSQLAELDPTRESVLHAALTERENVAIRRYVERMLAPLAAADAIERPEFAEPGQPAPHRQQSPLDASPPPIH